MHPVNDMIGSYRVSAGYPSVFYILLN